MQLRHAATLYGLAGSMTDVQSGGCYWEGDLAGPALVALLNASMGGEIVLESGPNRWRARSERCWFDVARDRLLLRLALEPIVAA